jgi:hypothetical protein
MAQLTVEQKAREMTYGLGISLYITQDGRITQSGPGREILPPNGATPYSHGFEMPKDKPAS